MTFSVIINDRILGAELGAESMEALNLLKVIWLLSCTQKVRTVVLGTLHQLGTV